MRAGRQAERETFLAKVLKDALEDAVTDWAEVKDLRWFLPGLEDGTDEPAPHGGANVHATLVVQIHGSGVPTVVKHDVSPQTVAKGLDVLMKATGELDNLDAEARATILKARAEDDADALRGDFGLLGDALVQLGLFGRVVY